MRPTHVAAAVLAASLFAGPSAHATDGTDAVLPADQTRMTVGSSAPSIDVEHWIQNGEGQFEAFTDFEPGKVYLLEFWATWCGPCLSAMPHLVELQEKHGEAGLVVIGVSDEPLDLVTSFLDKPTGEKDEEGNAVTFGDLTRHYCLTTDPDESVKQAYFKSAGRRGIPSTFLIGKDGHIEWIGHPMEVDEPLEKVLADEWDRDAFGKEYRIKQNFDFAIQDAMKLASDGDPDGALAALDELVENAPNTKLADQAARMRGSVMTGVFRKAAAADPAEAINLMNKMLAAEQGEGEELKILISVASTLARQAKRGDVDADLLKAAVARLDDARARGVEAVSLLAYQANLVKALGDLKGALELAEKALEGAPEGRMRRPFQQLVDDLRADVEYLNSLEGDPEEGADAEGDAAGDSE